MLGGISPKIAQIQEAHYKRRKKRQTGKAWMRRLIRELWVMGWQMWQQRNARVHNFSSPHFKRQLEDLGQQVRDEFAKGTIGLHKKDHHYLDDTKKEWTLQQDYPTTQSWVDALQKSRESYQRIEQQSLRHLRRQQKCLRDFLIKPAEQ